jgi:hypothetical protein
MLEITGLCKRVPDKLEKHVFHGQMYVVGRPKDDVSNYRLNESSCELGQMDGIR